MRHLLVGLAAILFLGSAAHAKDFEEEGRVRDAEALVERLKQHTAEADRANIEAALGDVPALHNALKTKTAMLRLQKAVAAVLSDEKQNVMARKAAVETLARLYDEKGVWSALKPHVPAAKEETVGQIGLAVLRALAKVQADGAINALEKLAASARDANAARLAIAALGSYSYSKKREAILKFLVKEMTRLRPGNSRDVKGRVNQARFIAVRDALVAAANSLTRRRVEGVELWVELYKEHKKNPEALFRTER